MHPFLTRALFALATVACAAGANAASPTCRLPDAVQEAINASYPHGRIITLDDLDSGDRHRFRKEHAGACPGATEVDFYGDNTRSWAVVLHGAKSAHGNALFVIVRNVSGTWRTTLIEDTNTSTATTWRQPPGLYRTQIDGKSLQAKHDVLVLCSYEAWAIMYAWIDGKLEKIWLSD